MRLPYCQTGQRSAFAAFVDLMKPSGVVIAHARGRTF
jgi:hypothetical protein